MEKVDINVLIKEMKNGYINEIFICENFAQIIKSCYYQNLIDFLNLTKDKPTICSIIKANYCTIVKQSDTSTMANVLKIIQELDPNINLKGFEDNKLHNLILSRILWASVDGLETGGYADFFREVLNEVLQKENITMADIEYLGYGTTVNRAWKIGNVVFKIGDEKRQKEIPYSSAIIPSFFIEEVYLGTDKKICELQPFATPIPFREQFYRQRKILEQLSNEGLRYSDNIPSNYGGELADKNIFNRYGINGLPLEFQGYKGKDNLTKEELEKNAQRIAYIIDRDEIRRTDDLSWY